jgi:hypothetical protein
MSIVSTLIPAEAAAANAMNLVRPLLGIGLLAALAVFFKPLLLGMWRSVWLAFQPRVATGEDSEREIVRSVAMMNRIARDVEIAHPSLAAELRAIAARN